MNKKELVSVNIVFISQSIKYLKYILGDLLKQTYDNIEINLLFNIPKIKNCNNINHKKVNIYFNTKIPSGFCENHNILFTKSKGDIVLILNPDMRLENNFIEEALKYINYKDNIAFVAPKLIRLNSNLSIRYPCIYDSAGMRLSIFFRHLDINSNRKEIISEEPKYVMGGTGAAIFLKKKIIEKLLIDNKYLFDEEFFMGREDADLCFRIMKRGFKGIYVPSSVGYHIRTTLPSNRSKISPFYNFHQLKNRYILMIKHLDIRIFILLLIPILIREISILIYVLIKERSSLKAYSYILKNFRNIYKKRKSEKNFNCISFMEQLSWYFKSYKPSD